MEKMSTLLANRVVLQQMQAGRDPQRISEDWQQSLDDFQARQKGYLLY
jgi:hypothetical protein